MSRLRLGASALTRGGASPHAGIVATEYAGRVSASNDDAEETAEGFVYLTSNDLELAMDDAEGTTVVGIRFDGVQVSRGAPIIDARVQFTAKSFGSNETMVNIRAEAVDDATPFQVSTEGELTERPVTSAVVEWSIPEWATNQSNEGTTTPNLASLISEVTNRPGWSRGNAIALLISKHPNSPLNAANRRVAHSYDSDPLKAPMLYINQTPVFAPEPEPQPEPQPEPGQVTDFSDGYDTYGFRATNFHATGEITTGSTLKDGTPFTSDMVANYKALLYAAGGGDSAYSTYLPNDHIYHYGRYVRNGMSAYLSAFRMTGDLRLLDRVCDYLDTMATKLAVGWGGSNRNLYDHNAWGSSDWSPSRCWIGRHNGMGVNYGTDISSSSTMNHAKIIASVAEAAWAFEVNADLTSPGTGTKRYAAAADFWRTWLLEFQVSWQGGGTSGWRDNYRGLRYPTRRAGTNDWPFLCNAGDSHSTVSTILAMRYWHLLFNEPKALAGRDRLQSGWRDQELSKFTYDGTPVAVWGHGFRAEGSPNPRLQGTTYVGYHLSDGLAIWLSGFDPQWTSDAYKRTVNAFDKFTLNNDGSVNGTIGGDQDRGGLTYDAGEASRPGKGQIAFFGYGQCLAFSSQRVANILTSIQNSHGGGFDAPTYHTIPSGLFMRGALQALGVT